jgi:hypothetical protein
LTAKLNEVKTTYNNNDLVPMLVAAGAGLWTWLGYQGQTVFANHIPVFWKSTGSFIAITSGIFASIWAGTATVEAAVKSEYWKSGTSSAVYLGANFLTYGNTAWMSWFLGSFEVSWVIAYLSLGIEIALAPFIIATQADKYYAGKYVSQGLGSAEAASFDWFVLGAEVLVAFGSWTAAKALQTSSTRLIGFFDIQNTDGVAAYKAAYSKDPTFDNNLALIADLGNHSIIVGFYYILGVVIANLAYWFALATIKP